jgi:hypothetical protein
MTPSHRVRYLEISGTSNSTIVETFNAEHLLQQMVDENAPQSAQRTASNPSNGL